MLALVKKPLIELAMEGESVEILLAWIRKRFAVTVLAPAHSTPHESDEGVRIEETDFWKEMEANRIGNLLAGARHKAGLTQAELARRLGVRQNMISDYERGRRDLSPTMASRLAETLHLNPKHLASGAANGSA